MGLSAYGQPAGYYPGRAEAYADVSEYKGYLAKNQSGIADIQNRIAEIRDRKRAPGCIGEDKYTCVATLAQKLAIADKCCLPDYNIFPNVKYDVNGKPVNGSRITFYGFPANANIEHLTDDVYNKTNFDLTLGPDGSVAKMRASLPKDPTYAQTQAEYDATNVYETVWAATARTCPTLNSADVAKWIENAIKPSSHLTPPKHWKDPDPSSATDLVSKNAAFCGRSFQFHSVSGVTHEGFQKIEFGGMIVDIQ